VQLRNIAALIAVSIVLVGGAERAPRTRLASGIIPAVAWPYLPGSIIPLRVQGFDPPYQGVLLGPGTLLPGGIYEIPQRVPAGQALLVAGNGAGLAQRTVRIATAPSARRPLLVVASYDDGLIFHDARNFSVAGVLSTGGTPSDVAVESTGTIAATDTEGTALTLATLAPWSVAHVEGVVLGDEVAIDSATHSIFVTDRDWNGSGALTRVGPGNNVARVTTGETAEGLAIDERRGLVYVANANDGTITIVDAHTMRTRRRFAAVDRVFSLALSPDGSLLYAISNQSAGSPFAAPGSAVAFDVRAVVPHIVARSAHLTFPLGVALDSAMRTLFVTDEALGQVHVLDAQTLRRKHRPLPTCITPWKPSLDPATQRLYIPCAGSDAIDVYDARTLARVRGAPFATGSYPLAVGIWHPK
jgi:DNA-binding beta-propeller fold protein YncE